MIRKYKNITSTWNKARKAIEANELEKADKLLMAIIWEIAAYTEEGYSDAFRVEGVQIGVWKERAWVALENAGLLPE